MARFQFDLLVIGAGSGGVRAARLASDAGFRVAIVEQSALGGTCVNVGCVPKKLMVYAAHAAQEFRDAAGFGWHIGKSQFRWSELIANKNQEISRLNRVYADLLEHAGVTLLQGHAHLVDAHQVQIDSDVYSAERILIATGSQPNVPEFPGQELTLVSDDVFYLTKQPEKIVIVGGGYIAVEFAGIFHGLGSQVTLLYRGPLFLRGFDDDLRQHLKVEMENKGIDLKFNTTIEAVDKQNGQLSATLNDGTRIEAEQILCAIGRKPNSGDLGLSALGVAMNNNGAIRVNAQFQSNLPSIYAIGDVIDHMALTPVAIHQAAAMIEQLYGERDDGLDYHNVPTAVFSQPNLATVGLTEQEACARYSKVKIFRSLFRPLKNTLSGNSEKTLMKIVVNGADDKVLGVHMVGP
ncbi:MAG TPA: glutathione-disulfide reductase, partial [Gammaproteobacteria bacterium]|nr:glutathione-disulfide reductase [Gammaproteobacteria bacterium]